MAPIQHNSPAEDLHPCILDHHPHPSIILAMSRSKHRDQCQAGPSAASTSSGEDALESLFGYRPKFVKLAGFMGGRGTRSPAHYDMHLHSQLILKDVVLFPDMLEQLAGVVDSKRFPSAGSIRCLPRVSISNALHPKKLHSELKAFTIGHESDLQEHYPKLQKLSSLVASTLFAGLDQWSSIFQFSHKPVSMMQAYALADGYLSLDTAAMAKAGLSNDLDRDIQLVIEMGLEDFLFLEFKSMNAGSEGVVRAISDLAGSKFPWVCCPTSKSCGGRFCKKPNNRFQFTVTGHKTGEDGDIFEDASDVKSASVLNSSGWKFKRAEIKTPKGTKTRRMSGDGSDEVEGGDIEDDGGANDDSVDRLSFNEGDFKKALKIIQQVWAEAVNVDATFMILNAGSREFIGIRDRKLQRLYLSPLIDLDDPRSLPAGYFKIHTGLQIAALHDAIQRAKRLKQLKTLSQLPKLHTFKYDRAEPYQDKQTNTTKIAKLSESTTTANEASKTLQGRTDSNPKNFSSGSELTSEEQLLFQQLREAGSLKISWNTYIDRLGSASSMTVIRSNASPPNDIEMEVHVMGHYPKSAQSYYCYVDNGETAMRGIVIKFNQGAVETKGLRDEYEMYTKLWEIGTIAKSLGIPKHFGLFEHEDYTFLVLLDSGDPALKKFGNRTPKDIYSQVQLAVRIMHSKMITHGNLGPENILVTKNEREMQRQWDIHVIGWKNGQDHRLSSTTVLLLMAQKAYNSVFRESPQRRLSKKKARGKFLFMKASYYDQEQRGTDSDQAASRRKRITRPKELPSIPYVCKSLFLTDLTLKQEWDVAVEKDRRMMNQLTVWNRY